MPILLQEYLFAEVLAYVYVHTLAYLSHALPLVLARLFHALPLEEALASVYVCILLLLTPCAELRSRHDECRATFTALYCVGRSWGHLGAILGSKRVPSYAHCTTNAELRSLLYCVGRSWGHLGAILGSFGGLLRPFLGPPGASWTSWGQLGAILGYLGVTMFLISKNINFP